ncbi:putative disease resistance RPP13-like protein 1 [Rhododendron vialii]|uniref:putative disease resistance RPP13-like protein 1 n=1 Tax=Rhododendron vialii TaxID=182163 RepID=UPI00265D94C8|nr:putative disease resistance RPP13-like protein 1 [Rhododendron vialii]
MVYNDEIVDKHFEMKAWVCVSEVFDIVGVTKAILEFVTKSPCEFKALAQVQDVLKKELAGKKFLIVLDDVWNKNHGDWSSLKSPFNDGAPGRKVIVTTRNSDVAFVMAGPNKYHSLKELSEDECWSVLAQHAFEGRSMDANQNLVSIGKEIMKKCEGLPLVARTLGGLLRCKLTEDEWKGVLNSKIWELSEEESHILPALRLGYYHLPSHLKKCFAYCSILPKDYKFEEEELVFLWMAEGLIPKQTGGRQMEDLGCEYFHELLSRSFFQPSSSGEQFVMHDLINDLAQFLARKTCFRLEDKLIKESEGDESISKARHSSYSRGYRDGIKKFEAFKKAKNLRTFLPCGPRYEYGSYLTSDVPLRLLPCLKRLRVLSLQRYRIGELSNSIGDLKHVRYLDLSCALVLMLPESIGTLYNLQTLILRDCKNLKKLPANTSDLISLRHLDVTGAHSLQEMPPKIGKLTSLQTFSNFIVGNGNGSKITELGSLIYLRGTLSISGLENVTDALDARRAILKDKQGLNVLRMEWSNISDNSHNENVESQVLDIIFQNCEKCTSLPPLGQLPSLAKLYIQEMKAVGNVGLEFYGLGCSNPFPALEILTFKDMPEWKEWTSFGVEEGAQAFARLSELSIKRCPKLSQELPRNLPRLRHLDIEDCPALVVAWIQNPPELNEVRNMLHFDSLVSLHLSNISIADSLGLTGLQELFLCGFEELTTLWEDEVRLQNCLPALRRLTIVVCPQLISLFAGGEERDSLKSLQELFISRCPSLTSLPILPSTLKELQIQNCDGLVSLPDLTLLNNLEKLYLLSCPSLPCLSSGSGLPPALKELTINRCAELKSLITEEGIKIECPSLESVKIWGCNRLNTLPDVMQNNNGLKNLSRVGIWNCKNLESLPEGWFPTTNFRYFNIYSCEKLEPLPNHAYNNRLASVEELSVGGFPAGTGLLSRILDEGSSSNFTNLTKLTIYDVDIGKLCGLHRLYSLRELSLENCDWVSFPEDGMLSFPSSLVELRIQSFPNLEKLSLKDFEILVSLERLEIRNCPKLTSISDLRLPPSLSKLFIDWCPKLASFPEQGLPPLLSDLCISGCPELASFPEQGLPPSLSDLVIYKCPNFASFPEQGLPPLLLRLRIIECPILKRQCEKRKGPYWRFIAHIPEVEIDHRFVFDPSS